MTSGNSIYETRLAEIEEEIDKYLHSLHVVPTKTNPIRDMLSASKEEIRSMGASECEQNSLLLTQHCITLQIAYNKLYAIIQWVDSTIDDIIIPHIGEYKAYSYEERRKLAIYDNSAATTLHDTRKELSLKKDSMFGMITKLESMAKFYGEIAKSKKWSK